jgi:single-strand DNA-binding protein
MFNKIILVGNLTRDIELRYTNGGTALAKTAIATTRKFTANGERKEEVCFVDVTFFGKSAEIANQYLRKGSKCLIEGRLMFEQWTDQAGQKRSKHGVTVESMQMLDSKSDSQNQQPQAQPQHQSPQAQANHEYKQSQPPVQQPQSQGFLPPEYNTQDVPF